MMANIVPFVAAEDAYRRERAQRQIAMARSRREMRRRRRHAA